MILVKKATETNKQINKLHKTGQIVYMVRKMNKLSQNFTQTYIFYSIKTLMLIYRPGDFASVEQLSWILPQ